MSLISAPTLTTSAFGPAPSRAAAALAVASSSLFEAAAAGLWPCEKAGEASTRQPIAATTAANALVPMLELKQAFSAKYGDTPGGPGGGVL